MCSQIRWDFRSAGRDKLRTTTLQQGLFYVRSHPCCAPVKVALSVRPSVRLILKTFTKVFVQLQFSFKSHNFIYHLMTGHTRVSTGMSVSALLLYACAENYVSIPHRSSYQLLVTNVNYKKQLHF